MTERTEDELGHALIAARGYFVATETRPGNAQSEEWYILVGPDGTEYDSPREDHFIARVYRECTGDLWCAAYDPGAALALCEQIAKPRDLCVMVDWTHYDDTEIAAYMVEIWYDDDHNRSVYEEKFEGMGSDNAEALARLALAALEAQAVTL